MTIGRHGPQSAKPRPRAASQPISPVAASSPNTEPPDRTTPSTFWISPPARSASVLIVPGAPPRTSAAARVGRSASTTVTPVRAVVVLGIAHQQAGDVGEAVARPRSDHRPTPSSCSVASAMTLAEATRSSIATNSSG